MTLKCKNNKFTTQRNVFFFLNITGKIIVNMHHRNKNTLKRPLMEPMILLVYLNFMVRFIMNWRINAYT